MPLRIQLSRRKGSRMPENTVKVDRTTKWGNPFVVTPTLALGGGRVWLVRFIPRTGPMRGVMKHGAFSKREKAAEVAIEAFRVALVSRQLGYTVDDVRRELAEKNIACWCPAGAACHGDVLLRVAAGGDP